MEDLNDKITGGNLAAAEWNQVPSEIQNVIENTGQGLTNTDLNQLGKGIANYVGNSNFYTDDNVPNVYTLTTIAPKQSITAYTDGLTVEFIPSQNNSGASQVSVGALGLVDIRDSNGDELGSGAIIAGRRLSLKHDISLNHFLLDSKLPPGTIIQTVSVQDGALSQTSDDIPAGDNIPQDDEGKEFMSLEITPTDANNLLEIEVLWNGTAVNSLGVTVALFLDSVVNALAAVYADGDSAGSNPQVIPLTHTVLAGVTSLLTFKIRAGSPVEFDVSFNGVNGVRNLGGVSASSMTIREVTPYIIS